MSIQLKCNLDLVTLLVSTKTVTNCIMSLNWMLLCSKWKNGLCKIVTKSQVVTKFNVTKFNVTKSRLHCTYPDLNKYAHMGNSRLTFWSNFLFHGPPGKNDFYLVTYFSLFTQLVWCRVSPFFISPEKTQRGCLQTANKEGWLQTPMSKIEIW